MVASGCWLGQAGTRPSRYPQSCLRTISWPAGAHAMPISTFDLFWYGELVALMVGVVAFIVLITVKQHNQKRDGLPFSW